MISLERCEEILNEDGEHYTREEVVQIRKILYTLGWIEYELFSEHVKEQTSDHLLTRVDGGSGRAGV